MVKKLTKTNPNLIDLIKKLKIKSATEDVAIWKDVAKRLEKSNRRTAEVNLSDISRYVEDGETIIVPGKILSNGTINIKVTVAALNFSKTAKTKIEAVGGKCISIRDVMDVNPKGSNIRIMQ